MDSQALIESPKQGQSAKAKGRGGRPTIGKGEPAGISEQVVVRCPSGLLEEVDDWRASQRPIVSRPAAIRQLTSLGLKAAKRGK